MVVDRQQFVSSQLESRQVYRLSGVLRNGCLCASARTAFFSSGKKNAGRANRPEIVVGGVLGDKHRNQLPRLCSIAFPSKLSRIAGGVTLSRNSTHRGDSVERDKPRKRVVYALSNLYAPPGSQGPGERCARKEREDTQRKDDPKIEKKTGSSRIFGERVSI